MTAMPPVVWPRIPGIETISFSQGLLWLCRWCVGQKIHEAGGNNRGPWPDFYASSLGLDPAGAFPWCTSGMFCNAREVARQKRIVNPFPATAKAVSVYNLVQASDWLRGCIVPNPVPGAVGVLDHGRAWATQIEAGGRLTDNGHIVIANETVAGDLSGNTNAKGSREGNAWAEKLWPDGGDPAAVHGGLTVCWINFDLAPMRPAA